MEGPHGLGVDTDLPGSTRPAADADRSRRFDLPGRLGRGPQLATGALSDHWGRKWMIAVGMIVQAVGIALFIIGSKFLVWMTSAILMGVGTALVYPTLLAAVSDVARPSWRATSVGVYGLWRDSGYAIGGLLSGLLADSLGIPFAIATIGGLTLLSGVIVAAVMSETRPVQKEKGS